MAVGVYNGGPHSVLVNLAYYYHYGVHRCNLAQDSELGEAVYAYVDVEKALRSIQMDKPKDRIKCLGLISGYLSKNRPSRVV